MEKRNLLEGGLSVELINKEARKEKLGSPPISKSHYYFTRKPLISARLAIAGVLLDEDSAKSKRELHQLFGLDQTLKKRAYKNVPALLIKKIKEKYPEGVTILDPFAGSGMIPFEALRLGVNVVALDYNPVAYLVMKASLEYPLKYGSTSHEKEIHDIPPSGFKFTSVEKLPEEKGHNLYGDVEKYAELIFQKLKSELSHFYPKHNGINPRAYIHAWAVDCPVCGKTTPLVNNWWLNKKTKIRLNYELIDNALVYNIINDDNIQEGNVKRGNGSCLYCSSYIENKHIVSDISKNEREIILAVYLDNRTFELPTDEDREAMENSKQYLKDNLKSLSKYIPTETMTTEIRAKKYLEYWYKLFNPRQLIVLTSLCKEINEVIVSLLDENTEYALAIGTYLSMILAKHVNFNSRCTIWQNTFVKIGHSLTLRRPSIIWNHAETNPFIKYSGSLVSMTKNVLDALTFSINELNKSDLIRKEKANIEIINGSILSWSPDRKFKFIVTDPPYYNDVQYPELMQFFQVWHNKTVGKFMGMSAIPDTNEELSVGRNRSKEMFETKMLVAIRKLYNLLENDGTLVMFYVHKSIEGWKYLVDALRKSGFVVTSTISLMTESVANVISKGKASIFHSLLITARKRKENRKTSIYDLEREIRSKIEERYPELERIYGKDRVNLLVSAHGIAIEVITQYSEIISFTKNTVDYALEMGQQYLMEFFAKNNLQIENLDPTTMIYTWLRHSLKEEIDYSEFNQTLKALGLEEDSIGDIIRKETGKRNKVRLLDFSARGPIEIEGIDPLIEESLIDAVHIALRAYTNSQGGITDARKKIEKSRYGTKDILNTIEALSKIRFTQTNYHEGEICAQFMQDWNQLHSSPQPRELTDWTER